MQLQTHATHVVHNLHVHFRTIWSPHTYWNRLHVSFLLARLQFHITIQKWPLPILHRFSTIFFWETFDDFVFGKHDARCDRPRHDQEAGHGMGDQSAMACWRPAGLGSPHFVRESYQGLGAARMAKKVAIQCWKTECVSRIWLTVGLNKKICVGWNFTSYFIFG